MSLATETFAGQYVPLRWEGFMSSVWNPQKHLAWPQKQTVASFWLGHTATTQNVNYKGRAETTQHTNKLWEVLLKITWADDNLKTHLAAKTKGFSKRNVFQLLQNKVMDKLKPHSNTVSEMDRYKSPRHPSHPSHWSPYCNSGPNHFGVLSPCTHIWNIWKQKKLYLLTTALKLIILWSQPSGLCSFQCMICTDWLLSTSKKRISWEENLIITGKTALSNHYQKPRSTTALSHVSPLPCINIV